MHVQLLAGRLAETVADYQEMIVGADAATGTRRWEPRTGISPALEQAIVTRLESGRSDREVSTAMGLSTAQGTSVRRHLGRAALPPGERSARCFADLDRAIIDAYQAGAPYAQIVRRYDVPRSTLYELLERYHVPLRRPFVRRRKAVS